MLIIFLVQAAMVAAFHSVAGAIDAAPDGLVGLDHLFWVGAIFVELANQLS